MRCSKIFVHSTLLLTIPTLILHPAGEMLHQPALPFTSSFLADNNANPSLDYDELLTFIESLESGELEKRCSAEELDAIEQFIINLSRVGVLPGDEAILEEDIESLHQHEFSDFYIDDDYAYIVAPSLLTGRMQIIPCKSWVKKQWCKIKHFAKKHKKAHHVLDGAADLAHIVPQLNQEVKDIGTRVLPDSLLSGETTSSVVNYQELVAQGHRVIDTAFSTAQAELYSADVKSKNGIDNFTVGILPPPGAALKIIADTSIFRTAGQALDKANFTKAGRALMKHGYREGSAFPKPMGNPAQVNAHGQQVLESILNHPEKLVYERPHPDFGTVIDIIVPNQWGARFSIEGEMIGFLEP